MSDDNNKPPYDVGYGKPPIEHRFAKGKSGNAAGRPGRPARALSRRQLLLDAIKPAERTVKVKRRGKVVAIPLIEHIWESVAAKAAGGHAPSQRFLITRYNQAIDQLYKHHSQILNLVDGLHDDVANAATGQSSAIEHEELNYFRRRTHQLIGTYDPKKDPYVKKQKQQQAVEIARYRERERLGIKAADVQVVGTGIAVHDRVDGRQLLIDRGSQVLLHRALHARGKVSLDNLAVGLCIGGDSYDEIVDLLGRSGVPFQEIQ